VFTHTTDRWETTHAAKDYTDREDEITRSNTERDAKVYRRLEATVLPLIRKMQKLHSDCSYHALLNYYCSSTPENTLNMGEASMESSEESRFISQKEISMISSLTSSAEAAVASRDNDIIRHHTPHFKVIAFVRGVLKSVIPRDFFGTERNLEIILKGSHDMD